MLMTMELLHNEPHENKNNMDVLANNSLTMVEANECNPS